MGYGDEILATAQARAVQRIDPRPVLVTDAAGNPRWSPLWAGNPRIVRDRTAPCQRVVNAPGARPYIDYARTTKQRWAWMQRPCEPGELYLADAERALAQPVVVIEPNIKSNASPNKQWGWQNWQRLVDLAPTLPWAQIGPVGTRWLNGVRRIETASYRDACGVLSGAVAAVLPEGGLHHAAATLGIPAVVLFGAYITPATTGYQAHRNLWVNDPEATGWRHLHPACVAAWRSITPDLVLEHLMETIRGR